LNESISVEPKLHIVKKGGVKMCVSSRAKFWIRD
jgi:hypothetical protein